MPTSSAVTPVSTSATRTYVPTVACSPGRSVTGHSSWDESSWDEIDEREDRDPHDVDEMPVEPGDLDLDGIRDGEPTPEIEHPERQQPEHADGDVGAVKSGKHEERGAEQVLLERQAAVSEGHELVHLEAEKDEAEEGRPEEPQPRLSTVTALHGGERQDHEQARHQKIEGRNRRHRDVEDLVRLGPDDAFPLVREVGRDERAEEEALGAEEDPHPHLAVGEIQLARLVLVRRRPVVLEGEAEYA